MNSRNKKISYTKKNQLCCIIKVLLKASVIFLVSFQLIQTVEALSEYPTYPTPTFHKIEKIGKELILDLNALTFNNELYEPWVEKSDYLFNHFLFLSRAIDELTNNPEECRSYLLEDLHYLNGIICLIEDSYKTMNYRTKEHFTYETISTIIIESKTKLDALYNLNQEIIL